MLKIITKKEYLELKNELKSWKNMYDQSVKALMVENKDYELKIDTINNRLKDIINMNSNTKKDTILKHIKAIIRFIEKGDKKCKKKN